jgi:hypothetical protein
VNPSQVKLLERSESSVDRRRSLSAKSSHLCVDTARPYAQSVVIRNEQKSAEPTISRPCTDIAYFDGKANSNCMEFEFSLDDVHAVITDEFTITVQMMVTRFGGSPRVDDENISSRDSRSNASI